MSQQKNTLAQQLKSIAPKLTMVPYQPGYKSMSNTNMHSHSKYKPASNVFVPPLTSIGEDGVNHINVWEHGETNLGKALSHLAYMPFKHSEFGHFRSVEGFWYYILSESRDDHLRELTSYRARVYGEKLPMQRVANFRVMIADANYQKILTYPALVEEFKELDLPLDSYYLYNENKTVRIRPTHAVWIVMSLVEIKNALREDRKPNFDFLTDENQGGEFKSNKNTTEFNNSLRGIYSKQPFSAVAALEEDKQFNKTRKSKKNKNKPVMNNVAAEIKEDQPTESEQKLTMLLDGASDLATPQVTNQTEETVNAALEVSDQVNEATASEVAEIQV